MSYSKHHATGNTKRAPTLDDLAFVEPLARRLASLASANQPPSRLAILSCIAAQTLEDEFPETVAKEEAVPNEPSYDADTEDDASHNNWPRFETGERVRVHAGTARDGWRYLTIADLHVFPPHFYAGGCSYPVLMRTKPRVVTYIDSTHLGRVDPW